MVLILANHFFLLSSLHIFKAIFKSMKFGNRKELTLYFGDLVCDFTPVILSNLKLKLGAYFVKIVDKFWSDFCSVFDRLRGAYEFEQRMLKILSKMQSKVNLTWIDKSGIVVLLKFLYDLSS